MTCEAMYVVFHSNFAVYIVYRRYKPCEFLEFVWTDCWGNKSNYVITSPANSNCAKIHVYKQKVTTAKIAHKDTWSWLCKIMFTNDTYYPCLIRTTVPQGVQFLDGIASSGHLQLWEFICVNNTSTHIWSGRLFHRECIF